VPAPGGHSGTILAELGFSYQDIEKMKSEKIIQEGP
jgi:crotonobetainyl-CoA:carnitine CoA-transferase CaiB-like acyl-CoA transferase